MELRLPAPSAVQLPPDFFIGRIHVSSDTFKKIWSSLAFLTYSMAMFTPYMRGNFWQLVIFVTALLVPFIAKNDFNLPQKALLAIGGFLAAIFLRILILYLWTFLGIHEFERIVSITLQACNGEIPWF